MTKTLTRYGASVLIALKAPSPEALDREVNLMYNYGMLSRQNEKKGTGGIPADYIPGVSRNVTVRGTWKKFISGLRARIEGQMMNGIDRHKFRPRKLAWKLEVDRRAQDLLATFERDDAEMENKGLSEVTV